MDIKRLTKTVSVIRARIDYALGRRPLQKNKAYLNAYGHQYETSEKQSRPF